LKIHRQTRRGFVDLVFPNKTLLPMLIKLFRLIWMTTPPLVRLRLIRLTQKKFTASVAAIITNEKGEVLLLDHVIRPYSSWGMPGGFLEHGEEPEKAIRRELLEETGLELDLVKMFRVRTLGRHIEILFTAAAAGEVKALSREINDFGWFSLKSMPDDMSAAQKATIREVLNDSMSNVN
jgi:8-oxo-dGTP diphosphatase